MNNDIRLPFTVTITPGKTTISSVDAMLPGSSVVRLLQGIELDVPKAPTPMKSEHRGQLADLAVMFYSATLALVRDCILEISGGVYNARVPLKHAPVLVTPPWEAEQLDQPGVELSEQLPSTGGRLRLLVQPSYPLHGIDKTWTFTGSIVVQVETKANPLGDTVPNKFKVTNEGPTREQAREVAVAQMKLDPFVGSSQPSDTKATKQEVVTLRFHLTIGHGAEPKVSHLSVPILRGPGRLLGLKGMHLFKPAKTNEDVEAQMHALMLLGQGALLLESTHTTSLSLEVPTRFDIDPRVWGSKEPVRVDIPLQVDGFTSAELQLPNVRFKSDWLHGFEVLVEVLVERPTPVHDAIVKHVAGLEEETKHWATALEKWNASTPEMSTVKANLQRFAAAPEAHKAFAKVCREVTPEQYQTLMDCVAYFLQAAPERSVEQAKLQPFKMSELQIDPNTKYPPMTHSPAPTPKRSAFAPGTKTEHVLIEIPFHVKLNDQTCHAVVECNKISGPGVIRSVVGVALDVPPWPMVIPIGRPGRNQAYKHVRDLLRQGQLTIGGMPTVIPLSEAPFTVPVPWESQPEIKAELETDILLSIYGEPIGALSIPKNKPLPEVEPWQFTGRIKLRVERPVKPNPDTKQGQSEVALPPTSTEPKPAEEAKPQSPTAEAKNGQSPSPFKQGLEATGLFEILRNSIIKDGKHLAASLQVKNQGTHTVLELWVESTKIHTWVFSPLLGNAEPLVCIGRVDHRAEGEEPVETGHSEKSEQNERYSSPHVPMPTIPVSASAPPAQPNTPAASVPADQQASNHTPTHQELEERGIPAARTLVQEQFTSLANIPVSHQPPCPDPHVKQFQLSIAVDHGVMWAYFSEPWKPDGARYQKHHPLPLSTVLPEPRLPILSDGGRARKMNEIRVGPTGPGWVPSLDSSCEKAFMALYHQAHAWVLGLKLRLMVHDGAGYGLLPANNRILIAPTAATFFSDAPPTQPQDLTIQLAEGKLTWLEIADHVKPLLPADIKGFTLPMLVMNWLVTANVVDAE